MSTTAKIPVWSWRDAIAKTAAPPLTKLVCHTIANHLSDAGQAWRVSVSDIIAESGLTNKTVAAHIANAVAVGLLAMTRTRNAKGHITGTLYQACFPYNTTLPDTPAKCENDESLSVGGTLRGKSLSVGGPRGRATRHSKITKGSSLVLSKEKKILKSVPATSLCANPAREAVKERALKSPLIGSEGQARRFLPKATPLPSSMVDSALLRRAEGLGLPLDEMLEATDRAQPDSPDGYFQGLCKSRLKRILPSASDALLGRALGSDDRAYGRLMSLLVMAEATS